MENRLEKISRIKNQIGRELNLNHNDFTHYNIHIELKKHIRDLYKSYVDGINNTKNTIDHLKYLDDIYMESLYLILNK